MQRVVRTKLVQVRFSEEELAQVHRLAVDADVSISQMLRRLAREEWSRRFGSLETKAAETVVNR